MKGATDSLHLRGVQSFLGEVVAILAGFVLIFALGIAFALKLLNYQRR